MHFALEWANSLNSTFKNNAAKRAIRRLTHISCKFTDPVSNVSIRQLLALSFIAIHDELNRQGTREDALTLFVEGLYEIQRGYNLDEKNVDDGKVDQPICMAGTFNKLMEKLAGIHRDVELRFITKAQASIMLPIVVNEEALRYLSSLASPLTRDDYIAYIELINSIQQEGIEVIWEHIQARVSERLLAEFGSIYPNPDEFVAFIQAGVFTTIGKLEQLNHIVLESAGFNAWLEAEMNLATDEAKLSAFIQPDMDSVLNSLEPFENLPDFQVAEHAQQNPSAPVDIASIEEIESELRELQNSVALGQFINSFWAQSYNIEAGEEPVEKKPRT